MRLSIDEHVIELPCPACGKNIKQKISWFKRDKNCCPSCGRRLDTDEFAAFRRELVDIEKKVLQPGIKLPKIPEIKIKL